MRKLVYGMMQSLDGYVASADGALLPPPGEQLGRHLSDHVRALAGMIYGRRIYEVMRYWDDDQPDWDAGDHDFAAVWRAKPKPELAGSLSALGLIDEYRLYFRPLVLGGGKPFFSGARPPLRLVGAEAVGEDAVKVTYTALT